MAKYEREGLATDIVSFRRHDNKNPVQPTTAS